MPEQQNPIGGFSGEPITRSRELWWRALVLLLISRLWVLSFSLSEIWLSESIHMLISAQRAPAAGTAVVRFRMLAGLSWNCSHAQSRESWSCEIAC
eukprot:c3211_g2_i1 orf=3-287(-)